MKCPICGKEVINVISNINRPADILGCDSCLPPEQYNEDLIDIYDTDPEWEGYKEEEDDEEEAYYKYSSYYVDEEDAVINIYEGRNVI